jgi:MFS family permease
MFAPLRMPGFRWLVAGRTCTETANAIAPVALSFAVLDLTGNLVDLGIIVGARSLALVVLAIFGGMLADRWPRSVILQGTTFAAAATQLLIAVTVLADVGSVPLLVTLSVANGAVAAVSLPATSALTPQTVPAELLAQANALARIGANTGRFTGAAMGGLLAGTVGPGWAIAGDAAVFALAGLAYHGVRAVRVPRREKSSVLGELRDGWQAFTEHTWVWVVVLQFAVVNAVVAGGLFVLGPAAADETIGRTAWGFVIAAQTVGALAGGFLVARWQPRRALLVGVLSVLVDVVPLVTLAWAPQVVPLLAAMFLVGVSNELFVVTWDVSLQENIPADKLARVYSYDMLGSFVALPVGEVAAGPAGVAFGKVTTLVSMAVLLAVATGAVLTSRQVRQLTRIPGTPDTRAGEVVEDRGS